MGRSGRQPSLADSASSSSPIDGHLSYGGAGCARSGPADGARTPFGRAPAPSAGGPHAPRCWPGREEHRGVAGRLGVRARHLPARHRHLVSTRPMWPAGWRSSRAVRAPPSRRPGRAVHGAKGVNLTRRVANAGRVRGSRVPSSGPVGSGEGQPPSSGPAGHPLGPRDVVGGGRPGPGVAPGRGLPGPHRPTTAGRALPASPRRRRSPPHTIPPRGELAGHRGSRGAAGGWIGPTAGSGSPPPLEQSAVEGIGGRAVKTEQSLEWDDQVDDLRVVTRKTLDSLELGSPAATAGAGPATTARW